MRSAGLFHGSGVARPFAAEPARVARPTVGVYPFFEWLASFGDITVVAKPPSISASMTMHPVTAVAFADLENANLIKDAVYRGGPFANVKADPIAPLLGVGNMGGFRFVGSSRKSDVLLCALYSDFSKAEWPDELSSDGRRFVYFGDNRSPGSALHSKKGNVVLRDSFIAAQIGRRHEVPPFFVFTKTGKGRDVTFVGLAVPGLSGNPLDDLVAIWRASGTKAFQNYRAVFTVLSTDRISNAWLVDIRDGKRNHSPHAPTAWTKWVEG